MSLSEGSDYVLAEGVTYHGNEGVGKGCMVGTQRLLLLIPTHVQTATMRRVTTRSWTLRGEKPADMIGNLAAESDISPDDLEEILREVDARIPGARLFDLSEIGRLRVRTGFFSRGIYLNRKPSRIGGTGFPLRRADARAFERFYRGHPAAIE